MKLEIVCHCWQYSRLLTYQLSSLVLYAPREVDVLATVFCAEEDQNTVEVVRYFSTIEKPGNVRIRPWYLPRDQIMLRLIGRNLAALATEADWVWFADCDYLFRDGALDGLRQCVGQTESPLVFPRLVQTNCCHELGDRAIAQASAGPGVLDILPGDFCPQKFRRAIGGIQIARGEVVRRVGYCKDSRRQEWRCPHWVKPSDDIHFRRSLGTAGTPVEIPNVFRVRHSTRGVN